MLTKQHDMAVAFQKILSSQHSDMINRDEIHFDLLRRLEQNPDCTQRELANEMGISLGKVNYCLKKLMEKGWVKAKNFYHSPKISHAYILTPKGIEEKSKLTTSFLHHKMEEYELLKTEIMQLQEDMEKP